MLSESKVSVTQRIESRSSEFFLLKQKSASPIDVSRICEVRRSRIKLAGLEDGSMRSF